MVDAVTELSGPEGRRITLGMRTRRDPTTDDGVARRKARRQPRYRARSPEPNRPDDAPRVAPQDVDAWRAERRASWMERERESEAYRLRRMEEDEVDRQMKLRAQEEYQEWVINRALTKKWLERETERMNQRQLDAFIDARLAPQTKAQPSDDEAIHLWQDYIARRDAFLQEAVDGP